jgi:arylsulfatase A-like enzyme
MIKPNTVTDQTTMTFDLFPTMIEIAGTQLEEDHQIDGTSMLPLMLEGKKMPKRSLFWYRRSREAIRKGPWKLLVNQEREDFFKVYQLYNLDDDPAEMKDLAEKYPQKVKKMKAEYDAWMKEVSKGVKWQRR